MIRLIQWLILGHIHKWKTVGHGPLEGRRGGLGERYVQQCEACGKVIKRDLL